MTAPAIIGLPQFQNNTGGVGLFRPGRGMLAAVDGYLAEWNGGQCQKKTKKLVNLMAVCRAWLTAKEGKGTALANSRRDAVQQLAAQAFARLQWESFEANKAKVGQVGQLAGPARALQGGYIHERTTYLQSGKQQALSGSTASLILKNAAALNIVNPPNFGNLTVQQFAQLVTQYAPGEQFETEVEFFRKSDRIGRSIVIRDGMMLMNALSPFDTGGNEWAWAMDTYGNFYSTDQHVESAKLSQSKRFNHSSLNAGKDVVCAGICRAAGGYLTHLDNASGHYKPQRADVVRSLIVLRDFGYDFNANVCAVRIMEMVNGAMQWSIYRNAKTLMANVNAAPDVVQ
jgi:hypothetical protein